MYVHTITFYHYRDQLCFESQNNGRNTSCDFDSKTITKIYGK